MKDVAGQPAEDYCAMVDATGKVAPGLLMGTLGDLGNFDECLATAVNNLYGERDFSGRFCTVYMNFKNNSFVSKMVDKFQQQGYLMDYKNPLRWIKNHMANGVRQSACIPSTCSAEDLAYILNTMGKKIGMVVRIRGCKAEGETKVTGWQTGILSTLGTMAALVCVGTGIDIALRTIFKAKTQGRPRGSLMNVVDLVEEFMTTLIANAFPSVETFLFISGFLLSYNVQKSLRNKTRLFLWVPLILLRRYIRLTVPAMFIVGIWLLVPLMADGPVLNDFKATFLDTCQRRWWSVMLHTNNFAPFLEMCLGHLWYINIDFQLYVALIFIPILMIRRPYLGIMIAAFATVASSAYTGIISYIMNYQPAIIFTHTDVSYTIGTANQIYFKPFSHIGPFCIGVVLGYYIYMAPKIRLSKATELLCWSAAVACGVAIVFAPHKWYTDHSYSIYRPECLLFASLHRVAWTLSVGWVVFACATGRGGFVMSFLSWPALVPLSRLSYGAFLTHVVILLVQTMTNRERIAYTYMVKTMNYFSVVMASYLCAYVLFLFCEAPVATLERTLLGGRRSPATEMEPTKPNSEPARTTENGHHHACGFVLPVRCGSTDESAQRSHL
ncbi:conserved hypothetical protein [Ixodes scapularis]|uniref:Nose resistant-to-fluoxetine protein N-terminal domain-containing protein n=1 Tax=Ixodes scapularis TaxID=6945 RepID=B7PJV6_IXOSC|nr:conserved hypothetical protein [Ixodes scapularis]|eukprot:XP_002408710.1 conserved hypothetical protein [Ixodes scapularis]